MTGSADIQENIRIPEPTAVRRERDLLRPALRSLHSRFTIENAHWDLIVRQARGAGMLARLAFELEERGLLGAVPFQPRQHLEAARALAEKHDRDTRWEVGRIKVALAPTGIPIILLKGAAYVMAGLSPARGRMFGDVDILVPWAQINSVEFALAGAGWHQKRLDSYDENYYREWMHQIPPLAHIRRRTIIDVHHTIAARTTRLQLRPELLFASAVPVPGDATLKVLAPADMLLHSATHLLNEGDFNRGLRDLHDLDLLLQQFGSDPEFPAILIERAAELDLQRPLYYALRYTALLLGTPVPDHVLNASQLARPGFALRALMDILFERALRSNHSSCQDWLSPVAMWSLYIRGHLLLMPPRTLLPHLARKAWKRLTNPPRAVEPPPPPQP